MKPKKDKIKITKWILTIEVVDSDHQFEFKVTNNIFLKTVANRLCKELQIHPISSELSFFCQKKSRLEIPLSKTLGQIRIQFGKFNHLYAKVLTMATVFDTKEFHTVPKSYFQFFNFLDFSKTDNFERRNFRREKQQTGLYKKQEALWRSNRVQVNPEVATCRKGFQNFGKCKCISRYRGCVCLQK